MHVPQVPVIKGIIVIKSYSSTKIISSNITNTVTARCINYKQVQRHIHVNVPASRNYNLTELNLHVLQ